MSEDPNRRSQSASPYREQQRPDPSKTHQSSQARLLIVEENKDYEQTVSERSQDDFGDDSPGEDDIVTPNRRNKALAKSHKMNKGASDQFDLRLRESKTSDISASPPRAKSSLDGRSKSAQRIPFGTLKNVSFKPDAYI